MCLYYWFSFVFFFKQKTAYEMRISDWSSDVCSSDLFILRKNLDGVRVDGQYSFYQHNNNNGTLRDLIDSNGYQNAPKSVTDGEKFDVNFAVGTNLDRKSTRLNSSH